MTTSVELTKLDPNSFEHMVNMIALRVLGSGHTGFGPGSDGGRDGFFVGEADYPNSRNRWKGRWYIQSKFHSPHLSKDPQKWLVERIEEELVEFKKSDSKRLWPDNWIIATNIDPSGHPMTGAFDRANSLVSKARPKLRNRFHIWGGRKILDLLALHPEIQEYYQHFLTPGHVLTAVYEELKDAQAEAKTILRHLLVRQFGEQQFTKLEQAGSAADTRPGIHRLFIDLPFKESEQDLLGLVTEYLTRTSARNHRIDSKQPDTKEWRNWNRHPARARVWFVKGGPGQGKSTISQYFCQIHRASLILQDDGPPVLPQQRSIAREINRMARMAGFWPTTPRIPIQIELKEYAQWFGLRPKGAARGILSYLAHEIEGGIEQKVHVGTLKRALKTKSWFVVFDGLDEVPHDVKDGVASEVCNFVDNVALELEMDLLTVCTSRPQGYSGQFSKLDGPTIELTSLSPARALQCAKPVLELDRSVDEARKTLQILTSAVESSSVRELMTTPLQSHIMAVVIRDGGRPPDRRWQLFTNFYQVIKRREANRDLPDKRLAKLLREDTQLLKSVHNKLGFALQAMAETSKGAQTNLPRLDFQLLVTNAVSQMIEGDSAETINILMEATTDRLVLVSTPDDGDHVRFDIRPLQEFFAAEFFYDAVSAKTLHTRMDLIAGDSHWREVIHFLVSALIENSRLTELSVAIDVIQRLDLGSGEPHVRLLLRRLARGALLTARLLQEGVLEQDKRIRQQMRKCLEPITGLTDLRHLKALTSTTHPNSKAWLIGFLFDSLREQDFTENIGAAIALTQILQDGEDGVREFCSFLLTAPPQYVRTVLSVRAEHLPLYPDATDQSFKFQKWIVQTVIELITGANWILLGADGVTSCFSILAHSRQTLKKLSDEGVVTEPVLDLLLKVVKVRQRVRSGEPDLDYGFLKGSHYEHDWTIESSAPTLVLPEESETKGKGVVELLYRIFRFTKDKNLPNLSLLLKSLDSKNYEILAALHSNVTALLPIDPAGSISAQLVELESLTETGFTRLMRGRILGAVKVSRPIEWLRLGSKHESHAWRRLVRQDIDWAIRIWSSDFWEGYPRGQHRPGLIDKKENMEFLVSCLVDHPDLLSRVPFLWGRLLEKAHGRKSVLRTTLLKVSKTCAITSKLWANSSDLSLFALKLPEEAALLPHLFAAICQVYSNNHEQNMVFDQPKSDPKAIPLEIEKMVKDPSNLKAVAANARLSEPIRAAAYFMLLMHPRANTGLNEVRVDLVKLYTPQIGPWYFDAVLLLMTVLDPSETSTNVAFISSVFDVARADYDGRRALQPLLNRWRETSRAPILTADVQNVWLKSS